MTTPGPPPGPDPWTIGPTPASGPTPPPAPPAWGPGQWYGYAPQPAPPRRRWLVWVLVAAAVLLGGCGALVATFGVRAYRGLEGERTAVNAFLSAVERGDTATAQGLLCDEAAPDAVQNAVEAGIRSHRIVGVTAQTSRGLGTNHDRHTSGQVTVVVTLAGGARHRDVVDVEHEHGRWLVCGVVRRDVLR